MAITKLLKQSDLFQDLDETHLNRMADFARETELQAGQILFEEGHKAETLFILIEGDVHVQVKLSSHPEHITITIVTQPGKLVGWSGFIAPHNYTATAVCHKASRLLAIDGGALTEYLAEHPDAGYTVMRRVAETISDRLRNIQQFVLRTF